ncbi:hypothetical protein ACIRN4_19635 [Pimelobacter simplex]|uniref:hypothetical protein n=1 Tax=Nocardioides simplex TaxID=2045 RepID=UPI0038120E6B
MTRTRVAVLTSMLTAGAVLLVVVVAWAGLKLLDGWGRDELWRDCATDPTASGRQGYCLVVSRYPATPVHSERTYLEIAPVHDGQPLDVRFSAGYPFLVSAAGAELDVDWTGVDQQVVVTDPASGASITYPAELYAEGR